MTEYSIVEYFGSNVSRCGYCKQPESSKSHGMWSHSLTVQDYQDLIDRGWRRSGKYCYKPTLHETCCVLYTIRCAALDLQLSKSQKKIIKKVNKYLANGIKEKSIEEEDIHSMSCTDQVTIQRRPELFLQGNSHHVENRFEQYVDNESDSLSVYNPELSVDKSAGNLVKSSITEGISIKSVKKGLGIDLSKPPCKKAKLLRLERRNAKLSSRGLIVENKPVNKVAEKTIEEFINDVPENSMHKLELRLTPSFEILEQPNEAFEVYRKYQIAVHHDPPEKCNIEQFLRFLVHSPLQACGDYGSYHQQYYLDGKLIAVGVIDILPNCVSSVYFYYDPDYSHMSLGTYGALRELILTRGLHQKHPDLKYYYMGYYINNCPKMRYKSKLRPSFLLCPEAFTWHSIEKCLPKIELNPYQKLSDETNMDTNQCTENDLDKVRILYQRTDLPYQVYKRRKRRSAEAKEIEQYASLVGSTVSRRILLFRQ